MENISYGNSTKFIVTFIFFVRDLIGWYALAIMYVPVMSPPGTFFPTASLFIRRTVCKTSYRSCLVCEVHLCVLCKNSESLSYEHVSPSPNVSFWPSNYLSKLYSTYIPFLWLLTIANIRFGHTYVARHLTLNNTGQVVVWSWNDTVQVNVHQRLKYKPEIWCNSRVSTELWFG